MIITCKFPNIYFDGNARGVLVDVLVNEPIHAAAIMDAVAAEWADYRGAADSKATASEIEQAKIQAAQNDQIIADLKATIEAQKTQLSQFIIQDWEKLIDALKAEGFSRWLADASDFNPELLDEVARLYAAAKVGDRDGMTREYMAIVEQYKLPAPEDLAAWQAVLDAQDPPVPSNLLWFVPPQS